MNARNRVRSGERKFLNLRSELLFYQLRFAVEETRQFDFNGKVHRCPIAGPMLRYAALKNELLLRSTEQLLTTPRARQVGDMFRHEMYARARLQFFGPAWPHTHTMDTTADRVYLRVEGNHYQVQSATIDGHMQWQLGEPPLYYVIENVVTKEPLARAIISPDRREGSMKAFVFSPDSRTIGIEFVQLEERHLNSIKKLSLGSSMDRSGHNPAPR